MIPLYFMKFHLSHFCQKLLALSPYVRRSELIKSEARADAMSELARGLQNAIREKRMQTIADGYMIPGSAAEEPAQPSVLITYGVDTITFNGHYEIHIKRASTQQDLLAWVIHLSRKRWVNTGMLRELIYWAAGRHGWSLHQENREGLTGPGTNNLGNAETED